MKLLNQEDFIYAVGTIMPPQMNMSVYEGHNFKCSCGSTHAYDSRIKLLAEGRMRVVLQCPANPQYFTCIKMKMSWLKFKGFEYVCGHKEETDEDANIYSISFAYVFQQYGT